MRRVARNVGLVLNCWRTRTLWACGLALLMILGTAATPDATPGQIVYVQSKGAEVRAEPNRKAQVIAQLRRGHKVIEFERRSGWVRIGMFDTSGRDGWVHGPLLGPEPRSTGGAKPPPSLARQELAKPKAKTKGPAVFTFKRKCPGSPDTPYEVKVRMELPPAPINHSLSIAKLTEGKLHRVTLGKMASRIEVKFDTEYSAVPFGNKFCFWVQSIPVTLRYPSVEIYIAKEYGTRSCQYQAILAHEKDHVRIAQDNLERYTPSMRSALTSLLIPTGRAPQVVASPEQAKREVNALARKLLGPVSQNMFADLRKAQAAIDTPEEYRRVLRRCRNW